MKAQIYEQLNKTKQWFTIAVSKGDHFIHHQKFEGSSSLSDFLAFLDSSPTLLADIKYISCKRTGADIDYLNYFPALETLVIYGGKIELRFPNMESLLHLRKIFINQQTKPSKLENISTAKNLEEIFIGDFTFNKPVEIESFDEFLHCNKLKNLFFSNAKFPVDELLKLKDLKSLQTLTINQKFEFKKLAELSCILTNFECKELKAWQARESPFGDVKINRKRMPYLNSKVD